MTLSKAMFISLRILPLSGLVFPTVPTSCLYYSTLFSLLTGSNRKPEYELNNLFPAGDLVLEHLLPLAQESLPLLDLLRRDSFSALSAAMIASRSPSSAATAADLRLWRRERDSVLV